MPRFRRLACMTFSQQLLSLKECLLRSVFIRLMRKQMVLVFFLQTGVLLQFLTTDR